MLLAAAQVDRFVVAVLDMQPDGVFVEFAAGVEVHHVEHGMAAPDDVEGRIEDMGRDGHVLFFQFLNLVGPHGEEAPPGAVSNHDEPVAHPSRRGASGRSSG